MVKITKKINKIFSSIFENRLESEEDLRKRAEYIYKQHASKIADLLGVDNIPQITITIKKKVDYPAATSGTELILNHSYFRDRTDEGAIVHEVAHILQRCPRYDDETYWLIEGIGDYVRNILGYKESWSTPHYESGMVQSGYQTTAHFLHWLEKLHGGGVKEISKHLIKDEYSEDSFSKIYGIPLGDLLEEYEESNR